MNYENNDKSKQSYNKESYKDNMKNKSSDNAGEHQFKEGVNEYMEKADEKLDDLKDKTDKYVDEMVCYVKDNPVKSLLTAIASGVVLGLFIKN